jgi:hypothetical protein
LPDLTLGLLGLGANGLLELQVLRLLECGFASMSDSQNDSLEDQADAQDDDEYPHDAVHGCPSMTCQTRATTRSEWSINRARRACRRG